MSQAAEKKWFILKVQSNREKSICEALRFGAFQDGRAGRLFWRNRLFPRRTSPSLRTAKRRVVKRKLYPGLHRGQHGRSMTRPGCCRAGNTWHRRFCRSSPGKPTEMMPKEEIDRIIKTTHPEEEGRYRADQDGDSFQGRPTACESRKGRLRTLKETSTSSTKRAGT